MVTITQDIIDKVAAIIAEQFSPLRIVLFGSCARDEITRDSDIDLLVVEDRPFGPENPRFREINRIENALWGFSVPMDILVFSEDEIDHWKNARNHVVSHALREGVTLYERS